MSAPQITALLGRWSEGDESVLEELLEQVYDELRVVARSSLRRAPADRTLETRGLIHEAYLKLVDQQSTSWANRSHFFAIAAQVMRRILVDRSRERTAEKRGGGQAPAQLDEALHLCDESPADLLALDEALKELQQVDPDKARLVELRFFGGFRHGEIAEMEGVSIATIDRRWRLTRAWLYDVLRADDDSPTDA